MKKRPLAFTLAISIFAMLIPMEAFADNPLVQAYIGSQGTTSVTVNTGDSVMLTASATGLSGNVSDQWYKASSANLTDAGETVTKINQVVGTTYAVPTDTVGTYYYFCACNGDILSNVVTVVVSDSHTVTVSVDPANGGTVHFMIAHPFQASPYQAV